MAMGLQEVHPSMVHMPLALAPLSIGADLAGYATDDPSLTAMGRATIGLAAAAAAVAAVTGLIAQEEVRAEGLAHERLITHRNLNLVGGVALAGMAVWRRDHDPGPGYLALGVGLLGTMFYTAYLGGKMVYDHGVGVKAAGGVRPDVPELAWGRSGRAARAALRDVRDGTRTLYDETREGEVAPVLRRDGFGESSPAAPFEDHPPIH